MEATVKIHRTPRLHFGKMPRAQRACRVFWKNVAWLVDTTCNPRQYSVLRRSRQRYGESWSGALWPGGLFRGWTLRFLHCWPELWAHWWPKWTFIKLSRANCRGAGSLTSTVNGFRSTASWKTVSGITSLRKKSTLGKTRAFFRNVLMCYLQERFEEH